VVPRLFFSGHLQPLGERDAINHTDASFSTRFPLIRSGGRPEFVHTHTPHRAKSSRCLQTLPLSLSLSLSHTHTHTDSIATFLGAGAGYGRVDWVVLPGIHFGSSSSISLGRKMPRTDSWSSLSSACTGMLLTSTLTLLCWSLVQEMVLRKRKR